MRQQIKSVIRSCNIQLRVLWLIRKNLDIESAKTLAVSLVLSKLDYCNNLYYGLLKYLINQLEHVQNSAARLVFNMSEFDHITAALRQLHPVSYRIEYTIVLITYKTLRENEPTYLRDLLDDTPVPWRTRSKNMLENH